MGGMGGILECGKCQRPGGHLTEDEQPTADMLVQIGYKREDAQRMVIEYRPLPGEDA